MPFIIDPSNYPEKKLPDSTGWEEIDKDDFNYYRSKFYKRHTGLDLCARIDFKEESKTITLPIHVIKALQRIVLEKDLQSYLVAHYICDPGPDFGNLRLAFVTKRKKGLDDKADKLVSWSDFDSLGNDTTDFQVIKSGMTNYDQRKSFIFNKFENEEFEIDKKGRAHLINKQLVDFFAYSSKLYLCFIKDEIGLSVAFSQKDLDSVPLVFDDGIYDHGGACCPI